MRGSGLGLFLAIFVVAQVATVLSSPSTVPAFLWSPHDYIGSDSSVKEIVHYSRISPEELTESVLSEGSWSNLLCSAEKLQDDVDIALVFIGKKLETSDISRSTSSDQSLVDSLKLAFSHSNVSMAFPYVSALNEEKTLESSLVAGLTKCSENALRINRVAYVDSCSIDNPGFIRLQGLNSLYEHISSRRESPSDLKTDLVVYCSKETKEVEDSQSDGEILSEIISSFKRVGAKYSILYASDPHRAGRYSPYSPLERFLLEGPANNVSANLVFCDGVCQIKSSLLEGLFVGIVLLIILISGLCCMMGIDTPSRFETPEDS
ncbi:uncharacterized protein LOC144714442 [Wolffia australiana]